MNAVLSNTPGARLRAIREALGLTQEALADRLGEPFYPVLIGRFETNKHHISAEDIEHCAAALGVEPELFHARGDVDRVRRALEIQGYSLSGTQVLDPASPAVLGFIAQDLTRVVPVRMAVVCAPMIGKKQVEACLKFLCATSRERVRSALLVSEATPEPETALRHGTLAKGVELHIARPEDVEAMRLPLTILAHHILRATTSVQSRPLSPKIVRDDEPGAGLPADAAFDCWRRNEERPTHMLLVGEPGSGKTMTLLRWARQLALEHIRAPQTAPCPIYIQLWSWWDATNFHRRLIQTLVEQLPHTNQPRVEQAVAQGRFILLLDGLDELVGPDPSRLLFVERALDPLLRLPCRAVITARSTVLYPKDHGIDHDLGGTLRPRLAVSVARLQRLEPSDVRAFLGSHRTDGGRALLDQVQQQGLSELARLPYILDVLVDNSAVSPDLPPRGLPLMSHVLAPTYRRWVEQDAPFFGVHGSELWDCFARVAAELRRRATAALPFSDLPSRYEKILRGQEDRLDGRPGSRIIHIKDGAARFLHRQIERFFFASWVVEQVRQDQPEALAHVWLSHDDIPLLAGMLQERVVVHHLTRWVSEPDCQPQVRDLAAYALGLSAHPDALPVLRRLACDPDSRSLRETAGFARMLLGDEEALKQCRSAMLAEASRDRSVARSQWLSLDMHASLVPPPLRAEVRALLRQIPAGELSADLLVLLHHEEETITTRSAAAVGLGYIGAPDACAALTRMLDSFVCRGPTERSPRELRLALAVHSGLEALSSTWVRPA